MIASLPLSLLQNLYTINLSSTHVMLTQSGVKNKQYVLPLDCFKNMEPFHRIRISKD